MKFTSEQEEFRSALAEFIRAEKLGDEARAIYDNRKKLSESVALTKFIEFGAFDFFSSEGGSNFAELAIVAQECGRNLIAGDIAGALFRGPHLLTAISKTPAFAQLAGNMNKDAIDGVLAGRSQLLVFRYIAPKVFNYCLKAEFNNTAAVAVIISDKKNYSGGETLRVLNQARIDRQSPELLDRTQEVDTLEKIGDGSDCFTSDEVEINNLFLFKRYLLLKCFEAYGAAEKAFSITLDYVKTRKQFGVAIGSFQAVQHQLADTYLTLEQIRGLITFALNSIEGSQAKASYSQIAFALNSAIAFTLKNASKTVETAIQLHGGIGFTWEYDLHFYLRRIKLIEELFGNTIQPDEILRSSLEAAG